MSHRNHKRIGLVGGGIVGLAIAYELLSRFPNVSVTLFEKEKELAFHQTGRNSGVLHAAPYYKPGSLKAAYCRAGLSKMVQFCREHGIKHEICGKVIVASDETEITALSRIADRATQNHVNFEYIGEERLKEIEPHVRGIQALHVLDTGIADYRGVCAKYAELIKHAGGTILLSCPVLEAERRNNEWTLISEQGEYHFDAVINAAGLHCDRVARLFGLRPDVKIVPFRGEYYELVPEANHLVNHLIYPVPDSNFPFLGVHFTRMFDGSRECGPNAVLAFGREGYRKRDINLRDLTETLMFPGFQKLALKHWRMGAAEMYRSFSKAAFVRALQKLIPEIRSEDIHKAPSGIRAQAVARDGNLVADFDVRIDSNVAHVLNAPSPAATASPEIGFSVINMIEKAGWL